MSIQLYNTINIQHGCSRKQTNGQTNTGCLSLFVGTVIVIVDILFPNFIFTTVLDVDFDSQQNYYQRKHKILSKSSNSIEDYSSVKGGNGDIDRSVDSSNVHEKPKLPPFMLTSSQIKKRRPSTVKRESNAESNESKLTGINNIAISRSDNRIDKVHNRQEASAKEQLANTNSTNRNLYLPTSENKYSSNESMATSRTAITLTTATTSTQGQSSANDSHSLSRRNRLEAISSAIDKRDIDSREESTAANSRRSEKL